MSNFWEGGPRFRSGGRGGGGAGGVSTPYQHPVAMYGCKSGCNVALKHSFFEIPQDFWLHTENLNKIPIAFLGASIWDTILQIGICDTK
jgi:hypothetical protein